MSYQQVLIIMILLHIFADFTLQGVLAELKSMDWWRKQTNDTMYRHDYLVGIIIHSVYWAIIVCMPFFYSPYFGAAILINAAVHAHVDNLKANKKCINLIQDQIVHFIQIGLTVSIMTNV